MFVRLELKRQRDSIKFLSDSLKSAERFNDEADKNLKEMEDRHKQRVKKIMSFPTFGLRSESYLKRVILCGIS